MIPALALVLSLQDDLSPKARELLEKFRRVEAGAADYNRRANEIEELHERQRRAKADERDAIEKRMRELVGRLKELRAALKAQAQDLLRDLDRAITLDADDPGLYDVRSRLHELLGDARHAAGDLDRALEKRPEHPPYVVRRAAMERTAGRYAEARRRLEPLLRRDPAHAEALALDGFCAYALNDFAAAASRFEAAAKLAGPLRREVDELLPVARERVKLWEDELRLRAAEEKEGTLPCVLLRTSRGEIEIELFENEAPVAVANFVALAERRFFDGTRFHRVIPNFMAQGGDPNSRNDDPHDDGSGGPGYVFADELPAGKYRRHFRGSLSMANSGPDTNGSQFFVTHQPTHWLDGKHVVFGRVVRGMEVVDRLTAGDRLEKVEVLRKRDHPYRTPQ